MKILIVEDHADTAEIVALTLEHLGHLYDVARSFAEAIRIARETRFDLVLCDSTLPDGHGCELFMRLNQLYPVPGIAATGRVMPDDIERYRVAGFADVLAKPFKTEQLKEAIDRIAADKEVRPFI